MARGATGTSSLQKHMAGARGALEDQLRESGLVSPDFALPQMPATGTYRQKQRLDVSQDVEVGAGGGVERSGQPVENIPFLDPSDRPGLEVLANEHLARLYQPVGRPGSGIYRPVLVPLGNAINCLKKMIGGRRVFLQRSELPQGWTVETSDNFPYLCNDWVDHCPKKLRTAQQLYHHVNNFHSGEFEVYKEDLEELMKEESKARREATAKRRASLKEIAAAAVARESQDDIEMDAELKRQEKAGNRALAGAAV